MSYTIIEHKHRFAVWAASRATTRAASAQGASLNGSISQDLLAKAGLIDYLADPEQLPVGEEMDSLHAVWRSKIITESAKHSHKRLTHGVAAKLINVYFKAGLVCGGLHAHAGVRSLHPPIDRVLLSALGENKAVENKRFFRTMRDKGWSGFSSADYQAVILKIRETLAGQPLWLIEEYWEPQQGQIVEAACDEDS